MNWRKLIFPSLLVPVCLLLFVFRFVVLTIMITPLHKFDPQKAPAEPDYADLKYWAMHPVKDGNFRKVDVPQVFWLHPTSLRSAFDWNEVLGDQDSTRRFRWTRDVQASVFANTGLIFAPHYRQATLAAYWRTEGGYPARNLAYSDVLRAFDHFIEFENHGRPFFIAGHSQGAEHGLRLLRDRILGKPLLDRMIAAYLIGFPIAKDTLPQTLPGVRICQEASEVNCLISYSTFEKSTDSAEFIKGAVWHDKGAFHPARGPFVCVNPVSWKEDEVMTPAELHRGVRYKNAPAIKVSARCDQGIVRVDNIDQYIDLNLGGNYHIGDFAIFYYDLQDNINVRWQAYNVLHKRL